MARVNDGVGLHLEIDLDLDGDEALEVGADLMERIRQRLDYLGVAPGEGVLVMSYGAQGGAE